jgi:hypothetical protein
MDTEAPKQARDKLPEHGHGEGVGAKSLSAAHALLTPPPRAVPRRQKFWRKGWHLLACLHMYGLRALGWWPMPTVSTALATEKLIVLEVYPFSLAAGDGVRHGQRPAVGNAI